jgi:hypothetical protein
MKSEYRSVNRNCCLGIWNLYFVFQFPNRRARCVSWILQGDIWILKSVQVPKSAARRGIWILDGPRRFLETGNCSPLCFRTGTAPFFFLGPWELGILESGNCDHFTGTVLHVCTFPATRKALATLQGPRRAQRLGQSARRCSARRGRLGIASEHARILAAPADARRIESRAALRRRRHLLSCDGHAAQPLPHDWICAAPAKPAGTGALSAVAGAVGALTGC